MSAHSRSFWHGLCLPFAVICLVGCASSSSQIRLNQVQVIGTHNSYHRKAPEPLRVLLAKRAPGEVNGLEYEHPPLPQQLSNGIRQIELDCFADPEGGRFAKPRGVAWATQAGLAAVPNHDPRGRLQQPGIKVMHVQDIDYFSTVLSLVDALRQVRDWSDRHPRHVPIFVLLELKGETPSPELTPAIPFGQPELADLEAEILSVFPRERILKPDDVRGAEVTLPAALKKHGWPSLNKVRGKVFFGLDNEGAVRDLYLQGHAALEGRLLFVSVPRTQPAAAWMKENDPVSGFAQIQELVEAGFLVRTRADADTMEARANDPRRRERALASGAQFISTDYPEPNLSFSSYAVRFAGGFVARANPVNCPAKFQGRDLEE